MKKPLFLILLSFQFGYAQVTSSTTYPTPPKVITEPTNFEPVGTSSNLSIPTYDANPSCTHPSVVYLSTPWNGYNYWMAFTPYPAEARENPSIVASNDSETWVEPAGISNPIEPNVGGTAPYNSDVDLVYKSDENLMYCFWRWSDNGTSNDRYYYRTSSDGINWGNKTQICSLPFPAAAPSFVFKDGYWYMWYVDARGGNSAQYYLRFRKSLTLAGLDTAPESTTNLTIPMTMHIWHPQIRYDAVISQFVGLLNYTVAQVSAPNNNGVLYWSTSNDGLNWNIGSQFKFQATPAMYRSTFARSAYADQNGATYDMWYSNQWNIKHGLVFQKPTIRPAQVYDPITTIDGTYSFLPRHQEWYGLPVARFFRTSDSAVRDVFPDGSGGLKLADGTAAETWCGAGCTLDRWYNQKGKAEYLIYNTTRPTVSKNIWNGCSNWGVNFNGTDNVLISFQDSGYGPTTLVGMTAAAYISNSGKLGTIVSGSNYFGLNGLNLTALNNTNIGGFYKPTPSVITGVFGTSNVSYVRQSSTQLASGSTNLPGAPQRMALGAQWATSAFASYMSGLIGEVVVWNNRPSATDLSTVESQQSTDYAYTPVLAVQDTYTDTNGTLVTSHNADIRPGSNAYSANDALWDIQSNKLTRSAGGSGTPICTIDTGISDGIVELTLNPSGTGGSGMVFRFADTNNYWYVRLFNNVTLGLFKVVGGVGPTSVNSATITAPGKPFTLKVELLGTTIRVFCNNTLYFTVTSTDNQSNTRVGCLAATAEGPTSTWDDLKVTKWY